MPTVMFAAALQSSGKRGHAVSRILQIQAVPGVVRITISSGEPARARLCVHTYPALVFMGEMARSTLGAAIARSRSSCEGTGDWDHGGISSSRLSVCSGREFKLPASGSPLGRSITLRAQGVPTARHRAL